MLGKLLKSAFEGIKNKKQKNQTKKPKDFTAQEVREHRENTKNQESEKLNDAQDQNVQEDIMAANNTIIIPDKTPALEEIQKTKNNITNSITEPKEEKNNNDKTQNIASLKNFLGDELKSMSDSINKKIDSINANNNKITQTNINVNKDILEVNKDALEVQKESLEEQKEAEYKSEHRFKETLKSKAKGMMDKGSSMIKSGMGAVKDKVKGNSGILGMIGKLLGGAYLLKTFWPLIEGKLWPFIKDKIFPFIKEHLKETIMGLGLVKLLLDPIGSLKLAVKGFSKIAGTLGGIAMKLGKFAAKGLFSLVKGVTKLAMDGVSTLASKAGELAKQGINKVKDMATDGLTKVKDMAMTGLSSAADKVKGLTAKVGEKFGAFTKNISDKMSGMGEKMASMGNKVKDIGSKLVEKGIGGAMKIGKGIGGVLKVLKPLAKIIPFLGIIVTVWDLLETFFPDFMTEIKSMFGIEKMQEIGSEIWTSIKSAVSGIGDWISEKISAVVQGYAKLLRMNPLIPDSVVDMIFGKDPKYEQQKLNEKDAKTAQAKLEDSGAIETNWTGKDEIKDWSAVEKYRPAVLQEFVDSENYSDSDNKKLQAIIDRKAKEEADAIAKREKAKKPKKETLGTVTGMKTDYGIPANSPETQSIKSPASSEEFYMADGKGGKVQITPEQNAKMNKVQSKLSSAFGDNEKFQILLKEQESLRAQILEELRKPSNKELKDATQVKSAAADLGLTQFANGGWTGDGDSNEIAGVVHKKEFVLSESMLKELGAKKSANDPEKPKAEGAGKLSTKTLSSPDVISMITSNDADKSDKGNSTPGKAISKDNDGSGLGSVIDSQETSGSSGTSKMTGNSGDTKDKEPDIKDIMKGITGNLKGDMNSVLGMLGMDNAMNIDKAGNLNIKGNSEKINELSPKERAKRAKDKISLALGGITDTGKGIMSNILPSGFMSNKKDEKAKIHVVKKGDTLSEITKANGMSVDDITKLNPDDNPKAESIPNIAKGMMPSIGSANDALSAIGITGLSFGEDSSMNIKGNSEKINELLPKEMAQRAKNKVGDALGSIGMGGKNIAANILPSGFPKSISNMGGMSGVTAAASSGLARAKNLGSNAMSSIGAGLSGMKGLFGSSKKDAPLTLNKPEASLIETDGTANSIKNIANAANISGQSKNKDVMVQSKREKNIGIDNKTRAMAAKTAPKAQEQQAAQAGNTTIIQQAAPKAQPQLTLNNTKFDDNMLSLVGGII